MSMETLPYPPRVTPETAKFWEGLDVGELRTKRCDSCDRLMFPPKIVCPYCLKSDKLEWYVLGGLGSLESFTEVWAAPGYFTSQIPYVLGIVRLDEDLRILSRIADSYESLDVNARVEIVFKKYLPVSLFAFKLVQNK